MTQLMFKKTLVLQVESLLFSPLSVCVIEVFSDQHYLNFPDCNKHILRFFPVFVIRVQSLKPNSHCSGENGALPGCSVP